MIDYRNRPTAPLVRFKLAFPWATIHTWHYATKPDCIQPLEVCLERLVSLKGRAEEMGVDVAAQIIDLPVAPLEILAQKIERTENEQLRDFIASHHCQRMRDEYIENGDLESAVLHGRLVSRYSRPPHIHGANNLGYLLLRAGDLDGAGKLLELAASGEGEPCVRLIARYNLAVLDCMRGNFPSALPKLEECVRGARDVPPEERHCACLIVPRATDGRLAFEELKKDPDLLEVAEEVLSVVSQLPGKGHAA